MDKLSRERVKGYLHAEGRSIVNELGEEIILTGWGLGNWLLCEGYMWLSHNNKRFDRPQRIEEVIKELTGSSYAKTFWKNFREQYVTKEDIKAMAEAGYNSVRIPLDWHIFMEDEEEIIWKEEGFALLDRCLNWCEEYHIYAFLDLHGAPGGQTGANIDNSNDDVPRLFLDSDKWEKGIKLWEKLAGRYCDRWIVGGYDLLNEPIKPPVNGQDFDYLLPKLARFYEEAIRVIRKTDKKHMVSLEGHHWATDTGVFYKKYDDNMAVHFHRYGCMPDISVFEEFIEVSKRLNVPLWLGETGENVKEWFTALYPLAVSCGFGYNLWPWKKMNCTNSPCSIHKPKDWDKIIQYTEGGPHPGFKEARKILDEYLENMKIENCDCHKEVTNAVFRQPGCIVRATDFEHFPGKGQSYSGQRLENNLYAYRRNTGMGMVELWDTTQRSKKFTFDSQWDRFALELVKGEFAEYAIHNIAEGNAVFLEYDCAEDTELVVKQETEVLKVLKLTAGEGKQQTSHLKLLPSADTRIRVETVRGKVILETVVFVI